MVHLGGGQRNRRRVDPHLARSRAGAVALHQRACVAGVGFEVQHAVRMGVQHRVALDLFVRRQADHGAFARRHLHVAGLAAHGHRDDGHSTKRRRISSPVIPAHAGIHRWRRRVDPGLRRDDGGVSLLLCAARALRLCQLLGGLVRVDVVVDAPGPVDLGRIEFEPVVRARIVAPPHERGAAHIGDRVHRFTFRQPVRDLDDGAFGVAVQQQVGLAVDQHRAAHLVLPVVVVRDAAQARLDAAEHDRHLVPRFLAALRIHQRAAVGPRAALPARRVGVVAAHLAVRRVAVDHRIHVAGGDAEEQVRFAQGLERLGRLPVGLRDDADAKALRLERAADDRHAEARVVDVGVARDDDHVARIPAEPAPFPRGSSAETAPGRSASPRRACRRSAARAAGGAMAMDTGRGAKRKPDYCRRCGVSVHRAPGMAAESA